MHALLSNLCTLHDSSLFLLAQASEKKILNAMQNAKYVHIWNETSLKFGQSNGMKFYRTIATPIDQIKELLRKTNFKVQPTHLGELPRGCL